MKILMLDIETSPALAYVWGMFKQNVGLNQLVAPVEMMCWVAKFYGEDEVHFRKKGDIDYLDKIWQLIDEADVVLHYNGKKFDMPHLNREFIKADMSPPSPYKHIDLCNVAKKVFNFQSNKLAFVAPYLGLEAKVDTGGFDLWVGCMKDDPDAWDKMEEYNEQDVLLLEQLYDKLLPWIPSHPNRALYMDDEENPVCPKCGGTVKRNGHDYTALSKFQRYKCMDCGGHSRSRKNVADRTGMVTTIAGS